MNGKLVGATDEEIAAAGVAVCAALEHPILRRAASFSNGHHRRETLILVKLDDDTIVEGVPDLALHDDTKDFVGWTVVDFKTDRKFAAASYQHSAQVAMYAAAVGASTGLPSRGVLLVV